MSTLTLLKSSKCFINLSIFHFIIFICAFPSKVNSQNLVDNWSFEDTVSCPISFGQIPFCTGWKAYRNTPDYFNPCNQNTVSVPLNEIDYQLPHSGNSYAGIQIFNVFANNSREILGQLLISNLQIGVKYYVSLYVVRAVYETNPSWNVNIATNKIGVNFSTVEYGFPFGSWPINLNSQVYSDSIITDTLIWTKISGSFISDSSYNYIGISNFFPDSLTAVINFNNNVNSYYFVDDICVSPDSAFCDLLLSTNNISTNEEIKLFPNPARDWIVLRGGNIQSLRFYDVSGRIVQTISAPIPMTIDVSSLPDAIYFVAIETKNGTTFQKLFITH